MSKDIFKQIGEVLPRIQNGWCSLEKAEDLASAVMALRSTVSLEIGVWAGRSLIPMAMAHAAQGHGQVWAVDPWAPQASIVGQNKANADWWGSVDHEAIYREFVNQLDLLGLSGYVHIVRAPSDDVEPPAVIDLLHVDGNHGDQAIKDVARFATRVRPGGRVFMDDIHWEGDGVVRAVDDLKKMGFSQLFTRDTGAMFERK